MDNTDSKSDDDQSDERTVLTKTSGMMDEVPASPERGDFEIGTKDGKGYLKIPIFVNGEVMEFSISEEDIDTYRDRREQISPIPTPPESVEKESSVNTPDGWEGGNARHTGGGIWCRSWKKQHNEDVYVVVRYQLPEQDGISVSLETTEYEWIGEIHTTVFDDFRHDTELQEEAESIMTKINTSELELPIEEKLSDTNIV